MDKLIKYRKIAHSVITEIAQKLISSNVTESILSIDENRGQYLVLSDSWDGIERSYGPLVHIEVKEDAKVWLRYDGTDLEIGQELLDKGISTKDLVLAFHSPQMRQYTGFAVA